MYEYENDMIFDFVTDTVNDDYAPNAVEDAIIKWFLKMGTYNVYFKLIDKCFNGYTFKVIGRKESILKWNNEHWFGDEGEVLENMKKIL